MKPPTWRLAHDGDRGAALVFTAGAMALILMVAAIVVDLAAARGDRASNQVTADAASTAGAAALAVGGGLEGCQAALDYVEAHVGGALTGSSCTGFPATCSPATATITTTGTIDGLTVVIRHPVEDADPLMTPGGIGAGSQVVNGDDGDRCERIGVEIREDRSTLFAGIVGYGSQSTTIHSVAKTAISRANSRPVNLLILERHECDAVTMSGAGSGSGGIVLAAVNNPVSGTVDPGLLAIDSDGTVNCGSDGTIDVDGSSALIRADGPAGCAGELTPAGSGNGCGQIQTFAPGPPGCLKPACSSSGTVAPSPEQTNERLTRAPVDWRYNCKTGYPAVMDIEGCPFTGASDPYIDQLVAAVGAPATPAGFQSYVGAGFPCTIDGTTGTTVTVPEGNWHVDCDLIVKRNLVFVGGNLVLDGNLVVESSGFIKVNDANTATYDWTSGSALDHTEHSADAAYLFMRNGALTKSGGGSISLQATTLYLSPTSRVVMSGGAGSVTWIAPEAGPFEDLAMWSEGTADHNFAGQAALNLEGAFFAPVARVTYAGNGSQNQVAAQFISEKLAVSGQGFLVIKPSPDRSVQLPPPARSVLIR